MKLLLATATLAVLKVITASADDNTIFKQHGSLQYVDNFLSPEESKHFYDTMESLSQAHPFDPTAKSRGNIMVNSLIQRRLKDVAGSECSINDDMIDTNGGGGITLQTRIINKSTKPHIDYEAEGKVVEDDVMFITLNSNPEAHFNHGGNSLPAVAGRLVRFAGNAVHGTTLNSGDVRLLGPFSIKNFASVGNPIDCSAANSLCIDNMNTVTQPFEGGFCNAAQLQDVPECYERDGTGAGDCPSGTGLCIVEGTVFSNGNDASCSNSECYVCTNEAGTCPPATTSTMATTQATTQASTTQASTTTPETTSQTSTTIATTTQSTTTTTTTSTLSKGEELKELLKALITAIILYFYNHKDSYDGIKLEEVMETILKDEGGIHGRRVLENKEDIKTLLISLLEEKLDLGEY